MCLGFPVNDKLVQRIVTVSYLGIPVMVNGSLYGVLSFADPRPREGELTESQKDFLRCPNCMRKLKDPCTNCGKPLDPQWPICPYCEAEVPGHAPVPRRRRRRQPTGEVEQGATASYEAPPSP